MSLVFFSSVSLRLCVSRFPFSMLLHLPPCLSFYPPVRCCRGSDHPRLFLTPPRLPRAHAREMLLVPACLLSSRCSPLLAEFQHFGEPASLQVCKWLRLELRIGFGVERWGQRKRARTAYRGGLLQLHAGWALPRSIQLHVAFGPGFLLGCVRSPLQRDNAANDKCSGGLGRQGQGRQGQGSSNSAYLPACLPTCLPACQRVCSRKF